MGIEGGLEEAGNGQRDAVIMPPGGSDRREEKDPIWSVNKDEALRLCRVYDEEMGSLYPVLDIDKVTRHATLLFTFMDALTRNDRMFLLSPGYESMQDEETDVLKIVMAIAMVVEETGSSVLGKRLIKSVSSTADSRLMGNVTLKDIQILTLIVCGHILSIHRTLTITRQCIISTPTMKGSVGALLVLQHVFASSSVCTVAKPTIKWPMKTTVWRLSSSSGPFTPLIGAGASVPECLLHFKTVISTLICPSL